MLASARYLVDFARFLAVRDFFKPLDDPEQSLSTNVHLARVPDEVRAVSADSGVVALPRARR
jgi:hypothetical protein